jgi:UDP-N-acetyl-D-glucosamine dehydrogenase
VPRVVSGIDSISGKLTLDFYKQFCKEVHLVESPEVAEAAKLLENSFRQVNISFINEFNLICRKLGIDTREVIRAADTKPYGFMRFDPSPGIGGHCIPVDPLYFQYASKKLALESKFIALATETNIQHGDKLLDLILKEVKKPDPRVLILGVAYKQGVSDTRESPALGIANALSRKNLEFGWFDPLIKTWQGTSQASPEDSWDVALVVTAQEGLPLEDLIRRGVSVFDFTGHFQEYDKVIQV